MATWIEIATQAWGQLVKPGTNQPLANGNPSINTTVRATASDTGAVIAPGDWRSDRDGLLPGFVREGSHLLVEPDGQSRVVEAVSGSLQATHDTAIADRARKANLPINAADYGVLPGNTAAQNNTPLANWLAAIAGKEGYLPAGTYNYSTGLSGSAANTKIRGAGKGNTILNYTGTGIALNWGTATTTPNVNLVIEGIRIDGTASGAGGLRLQQIQDFTLINVDVKGFSAGFGIWVNGANSTVSIGCDVRQNSIGWRVSDNANLNTYIGGQISGNTTGVHVQNQCYSNKWIGANIVVNNRAAYLQGGTLSVFEHCFFEGNLAGQTLPASVWIGELPPGTMASSANQILHCYFTEQNITFGVRVHRGSGNLIADNVHGGSGATHFVRVDADATDTILRDNVKGMAPLLSDSGTRTVATGPGYDVPSIASAGSIVVPPGCDVAAVTGTTTITGVAASHIGRLITLVFAAALTVTDGGNLKLAGNFVTTADDTITLRWDGTFWNEVGRSAN